MFLRHVEDLEEKRAIIYLEQLLEMRYNIVDALALVIKQDLVEDANIVPGDALRTSLLPKYLLLNVILIAQVT